MAEPIDLRAGTTRSGASYYDDPSKALGLSHRARARVLDEASSGDAIARPGGLREWDIAQRAAIIAAQDAARESEVRRLVAQGVPLADARTIVAREPIVPSNAGAYDDAPKRRSDLGASIEELMRADVGTHGGSRSRSRRRTAKPRPDTSRRYDDALAGSLSEEERARLAEAVIAAREPQTVGRPLRGTQPRMRVQGRVEPATALAAHELAGKSVVELGEAMVAVLTHCRTGDLPAVTSVLAGLLSAALPCYP